MRSLLVVVLAGCSFQPGTSTAVSSDADVAGDARRLVDAGPVDAVPAADAAIDGPPAFDPAQCPGDYNLTLASAPQSRYRLITTSFDVSIHGADCNDDRPGWTHLLAPDAALELQQARATITSTTFYVGAVQQAGQATTTTAWFTFTGEALPAATWQSGQPNDNGGVENDDQNFAAADDTTGLLNDVSGAVTYPAICECDGKPIPDDVAQHITDSAP